MRNARKSLGVAAIILLTAITYFPVLNAGFIWDDDDHLTKNPAMHSFAGLKQIWSSLAVSRYYPLTLTSFWVQHHIWGLNPLPYHAVNIALQAANATLLWRLLRRLQVRGAWVAAAVWAVHPVNVETVAWVTELKNTQSGLFFLLALLFFIRFEDELRLHDYVLSLICGAAAMLSKPSTVVLPGVILLCAWWRRGSWSRRDFFRAAPLVVFATGMSLLTIVEQRHQIGTGDASEWTLTVSQKLVLAGRAVWFYASKLIWPTNTCFIYPRWELHPYSILAWLPLAGLLVVAGMLWQFRRSRWVRPTTFGVIYFILALLPVLGFLEIYFFQYAFVADHFQYLASIGLIALLASAGTVIFQQAGDRGRILGRLTAAIVLVLLGVISWKQTHAYCGLESLWRDTLAKNPTAWLAHNNLGAALAQKGKLPEAIGQFEEALRIKPNYSKAHYNLGGALVKLGKVEDGIAQWEQAIRLKPDYADAHYNLGGTLVQLGRIPEAINHFEQALRMEPNYAATHYNLGMALEQMGKIDEAIRHYEQAIRFKPDYAEAHYALGVALVQQGRAPEAIGHWERALQINPQMADAHYNLGLAAAQAGRVEEAMRHWQQAVSIRPEFVEAYYNLGVALEQAGKPEEAIRQYEQALKIKPDYTDARNGLARLQGARTP